METHERARDAAGFCPACFAAISKWNDYKFSPTGQKMHRACFIEAPND